VLSTGAAQRSPWWIDSSLNPLLKHAAECAAGARRACTDPSTSSSSKRANLGAGEFSVFVGILIVTKRLSSSLGS
jgi:hypothetical protein